TDEALTGASQEQRVALLDAAIEQVGSGDASIAAKRAVTGSMHPYLDEMMRIIAAQEQATDASQRGLFDRPDVVAFFREISGDEQSVRVLGTTLGLYTQAVTATIMDSPPDQYALHYAKLHNTARLMGALSDGFELSEKDTSENAGLLSAGANTAFSAGVEVGLMALPGAAAPVAEILRGAAGVLIDKAVGDG